MLAPSARKGDSARSRLLAGIRQEPGATVADLARFAGVSHSTAAYHLLRLEKAGAVISRRQGNRLHHFLNGEARAPDCALTICRRLARSEAVLARLERAGPAPLGALAEGLPMTKAGVYWHLCRLVDLGLATAEGAAGHRVYRVVEGIASRAEANSRAL